MTAQKLTHFIGGKEVSAATPLESLNPSNTNEVIATFPEGSAEDVNAAADGADLLYTDVFVSMGKEAESAARLAELAPYQINTARRPRHALPARLSRQGDQRGSA